MIGHFAATITTTCEKSMPLELVTVPCLSDNYAFLLHDTESGSTALFDAPEATPIAAELEKRGWALSHIFLTHHHPDHIDGVAALRSSAKVIGASADAHRLPELDEAVEEGSSLSFAGRDIEVLDVSGHTVGHIAFYMPQEGLAFTGDSLMAMGCGRLFEGSPAQMYASLAKLAALPDDTLICSGHEYTASNARFAETVDPDNSALKARIAEIEKLRSKGAFTVPSKLGLEKATNPFLRANDSAIRTALQMQEESDVEVFAKVRALKDAF